ncbi:MAG: GspE/PulE/PilB domain-containing protein [Polyangiales bacterium]
MRIGELLQQAGLTEAQLDAGLRTQQQYGGRFASTIVDLGYVDADVATRALSKQKKVPAALGKHFDAIDPKAIARLSGKVAERLLAIPLGFTGESGSSMIVAIADPSDLRVLEELRFALGMPVLPGVALESRIRGALERHYGVGPKSDRGFISVARVTDPDLSPIPSGHVYTPETRATGSQPRRPGPPDLTLDMPPPSQPARPPSAPRMQNVFGDRTPAPLPPSVPPTSLPPFARHPTAHPGSVRPRSHAPPLPREEPGEARPRSSQRVGAVDVTPLDANQAREAIERATSLEARAEILLRYLRSVFEAAAIFVPRNDIAFGWKAFSPAVSGPDSPSMAVPLTQPSLFTLPYEARTAYTGAPPYEGLEVHVRIWNGLRTQPAKQVLAMPLMIDGQVAALIYAHPRAGDAVPSSAVVDLTGICAAIARRASARPR